MKKMLLSLFLLTGSYGATKPMEYTVPLVSGVIVAAPTAVRALKYIFYDNEGDMHERMKLANAWIARGFMLGLAAGLVSPVPVCLGVLPVPCTAETIVKSSVVLMVAAAADNLAWFNNDIRNGYDTLAQ